MIMVGKGIVALVLLTAWIAMPARAQAPPPLELFYRGASLDERVAFWFGWYAQFPDTLLVGR